MSRRTTSLLTTTIPSTSSIMRLLTTIILLHWIVYIIIIIYTTLSPNSTVLLNSSNNSNNIIVAPKHEIHFSSAPQFISFFKLLLLLPSSSSFVLDYIVVGGNYFMIHNIYGCNFMYAAAFTTTTTSSTTTLYNSRKRSVDYYYYYQYHHPIAKFKKRLDGGISGSGGQQQSLSSLLLLRPSSITTLFDNFDGSIMDKDDDGDNGNDGGGSSLNNDNGQQPQINGSGNDNNSSKVGSSSSKVGNKENKQNDFKKKRKKEYMTLAKESYSQFFSNEISQEEYVDLALNAWNNVAAASDAASSTMTTTTVTSTTSSSASTLDDDIVNAADIDVVVVVDDDDNDENVGFDFDMKGVADQRMKGMEGSSNSSSATATKGTISNNDDVDSGNSDSDNSNRQSQQSSQNSKRVLVPINNAAAGSSTTVVKSMSQPPSSATTSFSPVVPTMVQKDDSATIASKSILKGATSPLSSSSSPPTPPPSLKGSTAKTSNGNNTKSNSGSSSNNKNPFEIFGGIGSILFGKKSPPPPPSSSLSGGGLKSLESDESDIPYGLRVGSNQVESRFDTTKKGQEVTMKKQNVGGVGDDNTVVTTNEKLKGGGGQRLQLQQQTQPPSLKNKNSITKSTIAGTEKKAAILPPKSSKITSPPPPPSTKKSSLVSSLSSNTTIDATTNNNVIQSTSVLEAIDKNKEEIAQTKSWIGKSNEVVNNTSTNANVGVVQSTSSSLESPPPPPSTPSVLKAIGKNKDEIAQTKSWIEEGKRLDDVRRKVAEIQGTSLSTTRIGVGDGMSPFPIETVKAKDGEEEEEEEDGGVVPTPMQMEVKDVVSSTTFDEDEAKITNSAEEEFVTTAETTVTAYKGEATTAVAVNSPVKETTDGSTKDDWLEEQNRVAQQRNAARMAREKRARQKEDITAAAAKKEEDARLEALVAKASETSFQGMTADEAEMVREARLLDEPEVKDEVQATSETSFEGMMTAEEAEMIRQARLTSLSTTPGENAKEENDAERNVDTVTKVDTAQKAVVASSFEGLTAEEAEMLRRARFDEPIATDPSPILELMEKATEESFEGMTAEEAEMVRKARLTQEANVEKESDVSAGSEFKTVAGASKGVDEGASIEVEEGNAASDRIAEEEGGGAEKTTKEAAEAAPVSAEDWLQEQNLIVQQRNAARLVRERRARQKESIMAAAAEAEQEARLEELLAKASETSFEGFTADEAEMIRKTRLKEPKAKLRPDVLKGSEAEIVREDRLGEPTKQISCDDGGEDQLDSDVGIISTEGRDRKVPVCDETKAAYGTADNEKMQSIVNDNEQFVAQNRKARFGKEADVGVQLKGSERAIEMTESDSPSTKAMSSGKKVVGFRNLKKEMPSDSLQGSKAPFPTQPFMEQRSPNEKISKVQAVAPSFTSRIAEVLTKGPTKGPKLSTPLKGSTKKGNREEFNGGVELDKVELDTKRQAYLKIAQESWSKFFSDQISKDEYVKLALSAWDDASAQIDGDGGVNNIPDDTSNVGGEKHGTKANDKNDYQMSPRTQSFTKGVSTNTLNAAATTATKGFASRSTTILKSTTSLFSAEDDGSSGGSSRPTKQQQQQQIPSSIKSKFITRTKEDSARVLTDEPRKGVKMERPRSEQIPNGEYWLTEQNRVAEERQTARDDTETDAGGELKGSEKAIKSAQTYSFNKFISSEKKVAGSVNTKKEISLNRGYSQGNKAPFPSQPFVKQNTSKVASKVKAAPPSFGSVPKSTKAFAKGTKAFTPLKGPVKGGGSSPSSNLSNTAENAFQPPNSPVPSVGQPTEVSEMSEENPSLNYSQEGPSPSMMSSQNVSPARESSSLDLTEAEADAWGPLGDIDVSSLPILRVGSRISSNKYGTTHQVQLIRPKEDGDYEILPCIAKRPWTIAELYSNVPAKVSSFEEQQSESAFDELTQPESWEVEYNAKSIRRYWEVEIHCNKKFEQKKDLYKQMEAINDQKQKEEGGGDFDGASEGVSFAARIADIATPKFYDVHPDDGSGGTNEDDIIPEYGLVGEDVWGKNIEIGHDWLVYKGKLGADYMTLFDAMMMQHEINKQFIEDGYQVHHLYGIQEAMKLPDAFGFGDVLDVIFRSLLENIAFFASCNVVHRKINANNILCDEENGRLRIVNFGDAVDLDPNETVRVGLENDTLESNAPGSIANSLAADVFSVALVMCQLMFDFDEVTFTAQIKEVGYDLDHWLQRTLTTEERPLGLDEALWYLSERRGLWALLKSMIKPNPLKRKITSASLQQFNAITALKEGKIDETDQVTGGDESFLNSVLFSSESADTSPPPLGKKMIDDNNVDIPQTQYTSTLPRASPSSSKLSELAEQSNDADEHYKGVRGEGPNANPKMQNPSLTSSASDSDTYNDITRTTFTPVRESKLTAMLAPNIRDRISSSQQRVPGQQNGQYFDITRSSFERVSPQPMALTASQLYSILRESGAGMAPQFQYDETRSEYIPVINSEQSGYRGNIVLPQRALSANGLPRTYVPTQPTESISQEAYDEVEQWLLYYLPRLQKADVSNYCWSFIDEGFDSAEMLEELEFDDLHFMKKAHRRALIRKLAKEVDSLHDQTDIESDQSPKKVYKVEEALGAAARKGIEALVAASKSGSSQNTVETTQKTPDEGHIQELIAKALDQSFEGMTADEAEMVRMARLNEPKKLTKRKKSVIKDDKPDSREDWYAEQNRLVEERRKARLARDREASDGEAREE